MNHKNPFLYHVKTKYFHIFYILSFLGIFLTSCTSPLTKPASRPHFKNEKQTKLWHHAQTFLRTPYRLGGSDRSGMDCSGLVVRLYNDVYGLRLPHSTWQLFQTGNAVSLHAIEVGDLVFFREDRGLKLSHVGVYLGNNTFIHASTSRGVILSSLKERYYQKRYAGARRIAQTQ